VHRPDARAGRSGEGATVVSGAVPGRRFQAVGVPVEQAQAAIGTALRSAGFTALAVSASTATFGRTRRPTWALVTAVVLAIPTVGISLLLLLLRAREQVEFTVVSTHRGTQVDVTGDLDEPASTAVQAALTAAGARPPAALPPQPPPAAPPAPAVAPTPAVAPGVSIVDVGPWAPADRGENEATVIRPSPGARRPSGEAVPAAAAVTLRLDSGQIIATDSFGLLGRDPSPRPGDPPGRLVAVEDEQHTVSKTHLAFGSDGHGLWVIDRGSTNGTRVSLVGGVARRCPPGERVDVPVGARVSFGDRWFEVTEAEPPAAPGSDAHRRDDRQR